MSDEDLLAAPYRKLQAVEEKLEIDGLERLYTELYRNKYKRALIAPSHQAHLSQLKELKRILGARAYPILETYFSMRDPWFEQQHYSLGCLLQNINKVDVEASKAETRAKTKAVAVIQIVCSACHEYFERTISNTDENNKLVRCASCIEKNLPQKPVPERLKVLASKQEIVK